jgi:hypothetical protein
VRSPTGIADLAVAVDGHELQAARYNQARLAALLDRMVDEEQQLRIDALVVGVHQHGALLQLAPVLLDHQIHNRLHERMGRMQQARHRFIRLVLDADLVLLEADSLVFASPPDSCCAGHGLKSGGRARGWSRARR